MNIVVLGSTGMAGSMISHYFKTKGHKVTRFARKVIDGYTDVIFDAHCQVQLDNLFLFIHGNKPDVIINCIGYLVKESAANPAEAIYLNSYFPHLLENMTKSTKTKVIHISTDCIFDGKDIRGYLEDSLPTERNFYGRSKALGELNNTKDLTLRQSIIGPAPQGNNSGFLNWILTEVSPEVQGWPTAMWNGITTLELAKQIEDVLNNSFCLSGIVNLVPNEIISKYDLIKLIVKEWELPLNVIEAKDTPYSYKLLRTERKGLPKVELDYKQQLKELHTYMEKYNINVGMIK